MPTTTPQRAETRTVSIAAPPADVFAVVSDPRNLPRWAPAFARAVRPDAGAWAVDGGAAGGEFRIDVPAAEGQGTVDLLAAGSRTRGAFTRVIPNGEGSEFLFTLFFPDGAEETSVAAQMSIVEEELRALRALCER